VVLGVVLVYKLNYDEYVLGTASRLMVFGMLPLITFALFASRRQNNAHSRWLMQPTTDEIDIAAEHEMKIQTEMEENTFKQQKQTAEAVPTALAEKRQKHHAYKEVTLTKPAWCRQCKGFMQGLANQGYHCVTCHNLACVKCALLEDSCPNFAAGP